MFQSGYFRKCCVLATRLPLYVSWQPSESKSECKTIQRQTQPIHHSFKPMFNSLHREARFFKAQGQNLTRSKHPLLHAFKGKLHKCDRFLRLLVLTIFFYTLCKIIQYRTDNLHLSYSALTSIRIGVFEMYYILQTGHPPPPPHHIHITFARVQITCVLHCIYPSISSKNSGQSTWFSHDPFHSHNNSVT